MIRRARKGNPAALVGVCGCYAQTAPAAVASLGVDLVMGTARPPGISGSSGGPLRLQELGGCRGCRRRYEAPGPSSASLPEAWRGEPGRCSKVEDGCVNFCSYCIIPYARGPIRSLPLREAACEAGRLAGEGYRELVLTGIETSSWAGTCRAVRS